MAPDAQPLPTRFPCWCKAVYSWGGETKRDLGFIEGDLIECLNAGDGSWWMGRLKRDRRMVGLFPSNFVEVLDESFQPWNRNVSPLAQAGGTPSRQNSALQQQKQTPQKSKSMFRKPFTAYAAAKSPNPAAAAREAQKAGGSVHGSLKATHKPYSSMKRASTESRESPSPAPANHNSLRAISPRPPPTSKRHTIPRAVSPAPPRHHLASPAASPAPRALSPAPRSNFDAYSRAASPAPRAVSPAPHSNFDAYSRAASPAPRAVSPAPRSNFDAYSRAVSPAPPMHYQTDPRGVSPAPPPQDYHRPYSRAASPAPPSQYQAYSRGPSPAPQTQYRAVSPAPSFQYQAYSRGPSPAPFDDQGSPPPPPPPPHRVAYNRHRTPSPAPPPAPVHLPAPRTPEPRPNSVTNLTPSPLTHAMNDVMSSLQDMGLSRPSDTPENPPKAVDIWSPEAFDEVYQASAKKARAQTAMEASSRSPAPLQEGFRSRNQSWDDGPPQVNNYVQRMESRLRRLQQEEQQSKSQDELFMSKDSTGAPPAVPPKNGAYQPRPASSVEDVQPDFARKGSSRLLRHRKSAYDLGKSVLGRTFTNKTNSTVTTTTTESTNRSLMSGHSATNMSSTSAGSYYRKKMLKDRPVSAMDSEATPRAYGFGDARPETPFTGVTYHSSHASSPRPGHSHSQSWAGDIRDGNDPLGGLVSPQKRKSGFFRKMIDTAKTSAANARSTIAAGSISRPGSRAASRAASRAMSRAASRMDNESPTGFAGGTAAPPTPAKEQNSSVDWVQVRRDVNRSNSLSKNERIERAERCQMMDIPAISPIDILYESAEGDEGLDGLPIAEPTDFTMANLQLVDKSTRFINSIPLGMTPASLAQGYVCRPYRSDVQRLRAIFTWVSERICWEEDFEGDIDTRLVLQNKRGCSEEIAVLVAEMCASVGLHAELIRGYLKSPGETLDMESVARPNHFWNAVIVEGEWRIIDCSLAGPTNPKRALYSDVGSQTADPFYFLARPLEICYTHVPLLPEQQHICPPQAHEVLMALPCASPTYFKHRLHMVNFDTSLLSLENLELAHIYISVPEEVECVAEVEAKAITQDIDGDYFESGDIIRKPALAQAEWISGQKRYTIKALLPGDEAQGVLKVYAGPRGLMHSLKHNPHSLALALPITHTGQNPPYSFLTVHPTPHASRHTLYIAQPQCSILALNNTYVFCVRQHPSSSLVQINSQDGAQGGRISPAPFARPTSAMSMHSVSASGSNYSHPGSNPSTTSSASSNPSMNKPAKLAIQTPSGKIIRLTRKAEHMTGVREDGDLTTTWETVIKIGERGTWRGLVLADRSARWCVFAEWNGA
ncbi:hypothetical protein M011DRAFT_453642 [Sporormia fimetaria CBS 119925]|uniref:SH3 domain-containing protein n=1 Tax=Sporormia fimetaria CBS 119925 TaxID=1340428 RepID=A0A6A6UXK2_9PLEO|nr:hypothetical protein M011DRAFT_453642 [Sporormia fimetaria CBS 119925]